MSETLLQPVGSPRGSRKKLEQTRGDVKQKALAKLSPTPEPKRSGRKPAQNEIGRTT
jgi:hypothetical protein